MTKTPALQWFDQLEKWSDLEELIEQGQEEDDIFEATIVGKPQITKELKAKLGKCVSGFANSRGGVLLIGGKTHTNPETHQDVLVELFAVARVKKLASEVEDQIRRASTPDLHGCHVKAILKDKSSTGCILVYVPPSPGDPIQAHDDLFYLRTSKGFATLPYSMIRRMFAATDVPDLEPAFDERLVSIDDDGKWKLPITVHNKTSAAAEHVLVYIQIGNPENCAEIKPQTLKDVSDLNPGRKIFSGKWSGVVHRGSGAFLGALHVAMASPKGRPKRVLDVKIDCYAHRMIATRFEYRIKLEKSGFKVKKLNSKPLY